MAEDKDKGRKLRPKERRTYNDIDIDEDEIEGRRTFSVEEKLNSTRYSKTFVKELTSAELNLKYFQENGFGTPIFIKEKSGLGMRMPSQNFTVADVKSGVGSRRVLDVMDVQTQTAMEMTMKDWVKYYENPVKDRLLNVISLECSRTKLDNYVEQPAIVRQIDWVDNVWPQHLKDCQTESTNIIQKMMYPKVQKYCLMSVGGCYTDFHIDMSGTSVWYHILKGAKVFWLIPPTDENLELYENWTLSGKQGDVFFADQVEGCQRINLEAGNTFFIPTGWIHAVYTPVDSLVFGGNYLHSFNIGMQLRIWEVEEKTHVPHKFRYPFFQEIHWYLLDRYLTCVADKSYREKSSQEIKEEKEGKIKTESACESDDRTGPGSSMEEHSLDRSPLDEHSYVVSPKIESPQSPCSPKNSPSPNGNQSGYQSGFQSGYLSGNGEVGKVDESGKPSSHPTDLIKPVSVKLENCMLMPGRSSTPSSLKKYVNLNKYELDGLSWTISYLSKIPASKKWVPKDITNPEALLADAEEMLKEHAMDNEADACSGENVLAWPPRPMKAKMRSYTTYVRTSGPKKSKDKDSGVNRRRRVRCKRCEPCRRSDCEECSFCRDMKKYGGPGRMKQSCMARQCMMPELPNSAVCAICGADERDEEAESGCITKLMECGICWVIVHPDCLIKTLPEEVCEEGNVNEDLPNSWECPKCCHLGKQGTLKPRLLKGSLKKHDRTSASSSDDDIRTDEDAPRRGRPPGSKDKGGDSSDTSSNRRPRGRPVKGRGDEGKGTPAKKFKFDAGGEEQADGRGVRAGQSSWQVRNQSISHVKLQVLQDHMSMCKPVVDSGVNGHSKVQEEEKGRPLTNGEITATRRNKICNGVNKPETVHETAEKGVAVKRGPVVMLKQIDCVQFNGTVKLSSDECKKVEEQRIPNGTSGLLNGDCRRAKITRRSSSTDLKTVNGKVLNGESVVVNGTSHVSNGRSAKPVKVVVLNSPKKSARIAERKPVAMRGRHGSLKLDEATKCLLRGKLGQPVVMLERTRSVSSKAPTKKKSALNIPSSINKLSPSKVTKLLASAQNVKKSCLAVKPVSPPGTVGTSARSGRFIVRPSRFFD